ncbi:hypothetical protein [Marivivens marinus]|uniref:hypothetical protein n=1 Tax=Marivivens marinus TaxID=3110173 RepID=UPI003B849D69
MGRLFDNKLAAALLPLIPLVMGAAFKFAVIDEPNGDPFLHLFDSYIVGAWIEVISISMVGAIAWAYASAGHERQLGQELIIVVVAPLIALIVCIVLRLGAPKLDWANDWTTVYLPLILSLVALAFSSVMIREVSK